MTIIIIHRFLNLRRKILYVDGNSAYVVSDRARIAHGSREPAGVSVSTRVRGDLVAFYIFFFYFRLYFLYRSPVVVRLIYNLVCVIMRTRVNRSSARRDGPDQMCLESSEHIIYALRSKRNTYTHYT